MRRLRVRFRGYTVTAEPTSFAYAGQAAELRLGLPTIDGSLTLAQSNMDATTWTSYSAALTATERAAVVVAALTGTVLVEVIDGVGNVRASGTMVAPWATASGATVTIGEVTGAYVLVASGGVPDSGWRLQFRSGSRFVRGGFGLSGSGADFVWSLSSFAAGGKGTIGTAVLTATGAGVAPSSQPLVQAANLTYLGAFRVPEAGGVADEWAYGGSGMSYNAANNSLFVGKSKYIGEIAIPATLSDQRVSKNYMALPEGTVLQPMTFQPAMSAFEKVTGTLVTEGGRLVVAYGNMYDVTTPSSTHLARPLTLGSGTPTANRTVSGPAPYNNPRIASGYMAHVPPEWRAALGGPAVTGWVADSILSNAANGPAALAFDPAALETGNVMNAVPLTYYPASNPLEPLYTIPQAYTDASRRALWNETSMPESGCAIPYGTRSLLFIGRHGFGKQWYGEGGSAPDATPDGWNYDPTDSSKGEHAYPYRFQVWAYDLNDLAAVKNGTLLPYAVQPYSTWAINLAFEGTSVDNTYSQGNPDPDPDGHALAGVAYDPATRRIYVATHRGPFGRMIIHALQVTNAEVR